MGILISSFDVVIPGRIYKWDFVGRKQMHSWVAHDGDVMAVVLCSAGLLSAGADGATGDLHLDITI